MKLEVVPSGGPLGADVKGLDLREPLSAEWVRPLRQAFLEHQVLLFRDQRLSEEDQVRFTRYFGEPVPHVREQPDRPIPEIFIISNVTENGVPIGALGNEEIAFHSDLSYLPSPGSISILYAIEVPQRGGETMWANCYLAYDSLAPELRGRIEGLRAAHFHPRREQNPPRPAVHPIVRTHPETRKRSLYVNPHFTRYVEGLSSEESRALLDRLLLQVSSPRFVWTHPWRAGDLVMWDNRCTLHRRESFDNNSRRVMKRTQILGEPPY